jgi:hypothetical protein
MFFCQERTIFHHIINHSFMAYDKEIYGAESLKRRIMALVQIAGVLLAVSAVFYCLLGVIPAHQ